MQYPTYPFTETKALRFLVLCLLTVGYLLYSVLYIKNGISNQPQTEPIPQVKTAVYFQLPPIEDRTQLKPMVQAALSSPIISSTSPEIKTAGRLPSGPKINRAKVKNSYFLPLPVRFHHLTPIFKDVPEFGELIIPSIGVFHQVTPIAVENGRWDISNLANDVGHLQTTGETPRDELGMTFIGHVTVPFGGPGPFADLILLEHGEEIIYRWQNVDYIYEVSRILRVEPRAVQFLYHDQPDTLSLATCTSWNFFSNGYAERLITRATLVRIEPTNLFSPQQ